jgi:hypothetical protein
VGLAVGVPVGAAVGLVVRKRALHESLLYQKARGRLIWLASQRTLRTRIPRARHGTQPIQRSLGGIRDIEPL